MRTIVSSRWARACSLFFLFTLTLARSDDTAHWQIGKLRCEYLVNPSSIDETKPHLDWCLNSDVRGARQSAYRILVASSPDILAQDHGDLWDSGKVASDETTQIEYAGSVLTSREACAWKVMAWDKNDQPSAWSDPARWSMGLLRPEDWQAQWISDATLADPANRPLTPMHCYRSDLASRADVAKWVALDLGAEQQINSVNLLPARPAGLNHDFRTLMFPVRLKVEVDDNAAFTHPQTVVDQTGEDFSAPRATDCVFEFPPTAARYVRLSVTKLARWDGQEYGLALSGLQVSAGKKVVSIGAKVTCSDSIETADDSKSYLVAEKSNVAMAPDSKALAVDFPGATAGHTVSRVPMLRREFTVNAAIKRATLYVTGRGFYEAHLNGQRVGDELLAPGYTDYSKRIAYQSYDVTNVLHQGVNAMGALLGYGWYAGHMNLFEMRCIDGFFPQFLAQLEIDLVDGRHMTLGTNGSWRTTLSGPVRWSDLLDGEGYDCRLEIPGWDKPGFDDKSWTPAWSQPRDEIALVASRCQPVRVIREMQPVSLEEVKPGVYVYDLGQEISGYCRLKVDGPAGTKIAVRHAELLAPSGLIDVRNLWGVAAEDDYLLDGKGPHLLEPHFTYHGFRYVEVTGFPEPPKADALVAVNIRTDVATTGTFTCSNELYNRIMTAARWTQWNMMFNVPAGCAGRAERLAWLGDIRPCVQTAIFNMDTEAFFAKYTIDIRDEQTVDGRYCDITPHGHLRGTNACVGSPGWADAGVSLPWQVYVNFGDRRILEAHYESARRWVDFVHSQNPDFIWHNARGNDWGDWLPGGAPSTPKELGATAYFAHSADLLSKMAGALGRTDDAAKYRDLFDHIRQAFAKAWLKPDGTLDNDAEGNYALALQFDLLDEPLRAPALGHLRDAIHRANGHPTTGFWSSVEMLLALSDQGANADAAEMLNLTSKPSWGYMVNNSTTFWEAFDANTRNLSLNHWTHSAVGEWLWRNVAGINLDPTGPGWRRAIIRPRPTPEVTSCQASYDSICGAIAVQWKEEAGKFTLDLTIPANMTAEVYLPTTDRTAIEEGGAIPERSEGVQYLRQDSNASVYSVESGTYHFGVVP